MIVERLDKELQENATKQEIKEALEKVCSFWVTYRDQVKQLMEKVKMR